MRAWNTVLGEMRDVVLGRASSANSLPVVNCEGLSVTGGTLSNPVLNTDLLTNVASGWFDAQQFRSVSFQIQTSAGITAGAVTFEQTNDITKSPSGNLLQVSDSAAINSNPVSSLTLSANATRLFTTAIAARYVRVRVSTSVVGGSVSASALFSQAAFSNQTFNMQQASAGNLAVSATLATGASLAGDVGIQARSTTGGLSTNHRLLSSAASTNATSVKNSAGRFFKLRGYNAAASARYLKFYNKASAPTVGTDTPVITIALPPLLSFELDMGLYGHYFSTGIAYAITTGIADSDSGALTSGDVQALNMWYT